MNTDIINASYWAHFKYAQELAGYLELKHPLRVKVEKELNTMLDKIREMNKQNE